MLRNKRGPDYPQMKLRRRARPAAANKQSQTKLILFEHLFEATLDANLMVNHQGQIVLVNQQAETMFGYAPGELIGHVVEELVSELSREQHLRYREAFMHLPQTRAMAEERALRLNLFARHKEGRLFPVEITLSAVRTDVGSFVLAVIRDISQRLEHEREVHVQSEMVRLLQDVAMAANEADSVQNAIQFTLERICSYLDWPLGHAFLTEEDQSLVSTQIWAGPAQERYPVFKAVSEALRFQVGMGIVGEVLQSAQPVWVDNLSESSLFVRSHEAYLAGLQTGLAIPVIAGKKVVGVLEFFTEASIPPDPNLMAVLPHIGVQLGRVVERRHAQDVLRKSAVQLRLVLSNLPVILFVTDKLGKLILIEGKGVSSSGLKPAELLGRNLFETLDNRPDMLEVLRLALDGVETHRELPGQTGAIYETFFMPYFAENLEIDGIIGMAFDITKRTQMEAELEEMRMRMLANIDVERSRLAKQLHDGPLQDLYGAYYQIQEIQAGLEEPSRELTGRALETIRTVNATLRVICGELHPTTLVHLGLQRAIRSHAERMQERQAKALIHLDLMDDELQLNHEQRLGLYRIYQQLIANALEHAQALHIWVRLKLPPGQVLLEVQDNGAGFHVPEHWIDLVREGRMGLASSIERAQSLGGKLDIKSDPRSGTLIRVTLPRK